MLVSIVVPIYNTEKYLNRAIDSLINQTYRQLEILLVNDGSTDGSGKICDNYAAKDSRIHVIHKPNGGEATARNEGLSKASGTCVMFCDSDDEYLLDAVEKLVNGINQPDVDLSIGAYLEKTGDITRLAVTNQQRYTAPDIAYKIFTEGNPFGVGYIMSTVNGSIFRTSIIRKHNIKFNESFVIGNDVLFVGDYLNHCRDVYDVFSPVYIYYKFHTFERIQGMAFEYPDNFKLLIAMYEKLLPMVDESLKKNILANFFDTLIRQLVKAAAYEEYLSKSLEMEIRRLAAMPIVSEAATCYKRTRRTDSILIPLFFRLRLFSMLASALRSRGRKFIMARGKAQHIRLMVKD